MYIGTRVRRTNVEKFTTSEGVAAGLQVGRLPLDNDGPLPGPSGVLLAIGEGHHPEGGARSLRSKSEMPRSLNEYRRLPIDRVGRRTRENWRRRSDSPVC